MGALGRWGSGGTPLRSVSRYYEGDIPWLNISDLNDSFIYTAGQCISKEGIENSAAKMLPENTLLLAMYGSIGKLGITKISCTTNQAIAFCFPKETVIDLFFLFYFLMNSKPQFFKLAKGGTQQNISQTVIKKFPISLPPLAEQKRIVRKIEELFAIIDKTVKYLNDTKQHLAQYRQSVLQQAFSGKLLNIQMSHKQVKDVGDIVTGSTPSTNHSEYYGKDYPFYKPADLNAGYMTYKAARYVSAQGFEISRQLPAKSILVTCIGATIGKTGLIRQTGICNQQINSIIPSEEYIPEFVYFYAISSRFQNSIKTNASATTLPILNKRSFEQLPFVYCSLPEQKAIVAKIETAFAAADKAEKAISAALEQAKQFKQSILKRAFEGKLVPQDPNDEPVDLSQLNTHKGKSK